MIKLPAIISDGMIIEKNARIWGEADPGEKVSISFSGKTVETEANYNGCFEISFDAGDLGESYDITIGDIVIHDVKVGYVWLCGGQSNMELPISRVRRMFEDEIRDVNFPDIRAFVVRKAFEFNTEQRLYEGSWQCAVSENIDGFYATAYFFGKHIYERYGIPVGLICCAAGGSAAESWISAGALKPFPRLADAIRECMDADFVREVQEADTQNTNEWFRELDEKDIGKREHWESVEYNDFVWSERELTESWEKDLHINGSVWFRKIIDVPQQMAGCPAVLTLGRVVDSDFVYVNGRFVGRIEYQYPPSIFKLPDDILHVGKNVIAVRVISNNLLGGFIKDKPYKIASENGEICLSGKWKYRIGCVMPPIKESTFFFSKPVGLYNAMVSPVIRYPISGAIWYQGEANTHHPDDYAELMDALVKEWRLKSGKDFPFIFTQLANFEADSSAYPKSLWACLRDKQLACLDIPNTAMASAIDCGEYNDLHPLDKKTVGERLGLAARALYYGEDIVYSGPIAKKAEFDGDKITIYFDFTGGGLVTSSGVPERFEIETESGGCFKAEARIRLDTVIVHCEAAWMPKFVRYAWADNPTANLYNAEGLPASPFRLEV